MQALLLTALLSIFSKLVNEQFFERVATKGIIWLLRKLASMTETRLDDDIVNDIVAQLSPPERDYDALLKAAADQGNYAEIARLVNERDKQHG